MSLQLISRSYYIVIFFFLLAMQSCQSSYQKRVEKNNDIQSDNFIDLHRSLIDFEEYTIDSLLSFLDIGFRKDTTGIRININRSNSLESDYPQDGDDVIVAYNCIIFNDQVNFDNHFSDTLRFRIGYSKQMKGLNYAIKLLKIGDNAKIIIPSYLGFGLSGYGKLVPPYSTLLLNVKLLKIN